MSSFSPSLSPLPPNSLHLRTTAHFHRIGVLYCPSGTCHYLEFPGCAVHSCLLTHQKGNGYYACQPCIDEKRAEGGDEGDEMVSFITATCATDTAEPWSVACQGCGLVKADTVEWIISDDQAHQLAEATHRETLDVIPILAVQCERCRTTQFPIVHGHLTRNVKGEIVGRVEETSLIDETRVYKISEFVFHHYSCDCQGSLRTIPISISKLEGRFGGESMPNTQRLPVDEKLMTGFISPFRWITGEQSAREREERETRNNAYVLSSLQIKQFKAPVWRDRSYIGQFGDAFVRNTELEGGLIAPSIAAVELILRRLCRNASESSYPCLLGFDNEHVTILKKVSDVFEVGVTTATRAQDYMVSLNDKKVLQFNKETQFMLVLTEWKKTLHGLQRGEWAICPGGWSSAKGGHGIMHCVFRSHDDTYSFTISNTGAGLRWHPHMVTASPLKTRYQCSMRFDNIPAWKMLDDAFWIMLWRLQLVPSNDNSHLVIYDILLPHLTGDIVSVSMSSSDPAAAEWVTPQRSGNCYYRCVIECLRFLCRSFGLSRYHFKVLMFSIRYEYTCMIIEDLDRAMSFASHTALHDESDLDMIRLGTKQLAYTAVKENHAGRLQAHHLQEVFELIDRIEHRIQHLSFEVNYRTKKLPLLSLGKDIAQKAAENYEVKGSTLSAGLDTTSNIFVDPDCLTFSGFESFRDLTSSESADWVKRLGDTVTVAMPFSVEWDVLPDHAPCDLDGCIQLLDVALVLCDNVHLITSIASYVHVIGFIHTLFMSSLPVPKPSTGSSECAWRSRALSFSEQQHIIHSLLRLSRIYLSSFYSVDFPSNFPDSYRVVVMGLMVAVCDCVMRLSPFDVNNPIVKVYDGNECFGPTLTNGSGAVLGSITGQSEILEPQVAIARARVLEYYNSIDKRIKRRILPFANSGAHRTAQHQPNDDSLLFVREICLEAGYVIETRGQGKELSEPEAVCKLLYHDSENLSGYSNNGQVPQLAREHPEFSDMRDLLFLFKLSMISQTVVHRVVPLGRWREKDARIFWSVQHLPMAGTSDVWVFARAFDRRDVLSIKTYQRISPCNPNHYVRKPNTSSQFTGLSSLLHGSGSGSSIFSPDRSRLASLFDGASNTSDRKASSDILSESDVIHAESFSAPFDRSTTTIETAEKLLSSLTVPYARIPLLLSFFANEDYISLLALRSFQRVLDCCVFEGFEWTTVEDTSALSTIPALPGRLGTTWGLLINELCHSPASFISPLIKMIDYGLGYNSGSIFSHSSIIVLYLAKLAVRIDLFIRHSRTLINSHELRCEPDISAILLELHKQLLQCVRAKLLPALLDFLPGVSSDIDRAVWLHSHIALVSECLCAQEDVNSSNNLSVFLSSMSFVSTWHVFGVGIGKTVEDEKELHSSPDSVHDAQGSLSLMDLASSLSTSMNKSKQKNANLELLEKQSKLHAFVISEMDMMAAIQRIRPRIHVWLHQASHAAIDTLLDRLITVVHGEEFRSPRSHTSASARRWQPLGNIYRYQNIQSGIQVDLQTASVFAESDIIPVNDILARHPNYLEIFGSHPKHCSVSSRYLAASKFVLFGHPFTLQYWSCAEDSEQLLCSPQAIPREIGHVIDDANYVKGSARTVTGLWKCGNKKCEYENDFVNERCVKCESYRPTVSEVEKQGILYRDVLYTRRYGSTPLPSTEKWITDLLEQVLFENFGEDRELLNYSLFLPSNITPEDCNQVSLLALDGHTWKQYLCYRKLRLCHVFMFVEHGRRLYRSLIYSSDARRCFKALVPGWQDRSKSWEEICRFQSGNLLELNIPQESLIIERIDAQGRATCSYLPRNTLEGLVPSYFLEHFHFWRVLQPRQADSFDITAYPKSCSSDAGPRPEYGLFIRVLFSAYRQYEALIRKVPLKADDQASLDELDVEPSDSTGTFLINSLFFNDLDRLGINRITAVLARVEDASHILIWALGHPNGNLQLHSIDLPRLQLSFFPQQNEHGEIRLYSRDHAGFFLTDYRDGNDRLASLCAPLPFSLLLENDRHDLRILAINCDLHRPRIFAAPFHTELVANRSSAEWFSRAQTRYFVYNVHISLTFLSHDTLASGIFLFFCYLLARQYAKAYAIAEVCQIDKALTSEEKYVLQMVQRTLNDEHPNAHACRLKLALGIPILNWMDELGNSFQLASEYTRYISKLMHVSASCRLALEDELMIVELCRNDKGIIEEETVENHSLCLRHMFNHPQDSTASLTFKPLTREGLSNPWLTFEASVAPFFAQYCASNWNPSASGWSGTICYKRPSSSACMSYELMETLNDFSADTIIGAQKKLGFFFLYELLTGTLPTRLSVTDADCSFTLGVLLSQCAFSKLTKHGKKPRTGPQMLPFVVCCVLSSRVFNSINNPCLRSIYIPASSFPPLPVIPSQLHAIELEHGCPLHRLGNPASNTIRDIAIFFAGFSQFCTKWVQYPQHTSSSHTSTAAQIVNFIHVPNDKPTNSACNQHIQSTFNFGESGCHLDVDELADLTGSLFAHSVLHNSSDLLHVSSEQQTFLINLPFSFTKKQSSSHASRAMLNRLAQDIRDFSDSMQATPVFSLVGVSGCDWTRLTKTVSSLLNSLQKLQSHESIQVEVSLLFLLRISNYIPNTPQLFNDEMWYETIAIYEGSSDLLVDQSSKYCHVLSRYSGEKMTIDLSYLVSLLLSSSRISDLATINPFLPPELAEAVFNITAAVLLRTTRLGLINRVLADCQTALVLLQEAANGDTKQANQTELLQSLSIQSKLITDALHCRRTYVSFSNNSVSFDPRYLAFEFIFNIILRKKQVDLVRDLTKTAQTRLSSCNQLLMGDGKTTVISPLLTLILADGELAVIHVVPSALLPMSRQILRSRFTTLLRKRIVTFEFERTMDDSPRIMSKILLEIDSVRRHRGAIIASASSIKSLFLKLIEMVKELQSFPSNSERYGIIKQSTANIVGIFSLFKDGVLLLDEVDVCLHPLRSELNFPIGTRKLLQPHPGRYLLAMHILDGLLYRTTTYLSIPSMRSSPEVITILKEIDHLIGSERRQLTVQLVPHLVLLSRDMYHHKLKPLLARWTTLYLRSQQGIGTSAEFTEEKCNLVLCQGWTHVDTTCIALTSSQLSLLNLAHSWINDYVPHVMSKINRVSYGIVHDHEQSHMQSSSSARHLTAIPFVAKDVPSKSSEFAHPDVLIGLTILSYHIQGLRKSDIVQIVQSLQKSASEEVGASHLRYSCQLFKSFVDEALARQKLHQHVGTVKILPLLKFQVNDDYQISTLFALIDHLPSLIVHYLSTLVFPKCLVTNTHNLSSSAQELGGEILFKTRLGFSGTPSSLLPLELGGCRYERGADGLVLNTLCSHLVVSHKVEMDWNVLGLLESIAKQATLNHENCCHAFIDSGALITGLSNEEVASHLLDFGLIGFDGVIYFDVGDETMIMLRDTRTCIPLSQCGVAVSRRFSFYDQSHSTGIDLKHPPTALAIVTLSKDMTLRDYSQAAYRMRGVGQGQRILLIIIEEVLTLIRHSLHLTKEQILVQEHLPQHVCAWLTLNSIHADQLQFQQLCHQNIANVFRKRAFYVIRNEIQDYKHWLQNTTVSSPRFWNAVGLFLEPTSFDISAAVDKYYPSFFNTLKEGILNHVDWIEEPKQCIDIGEVLTRALEDESSIPLVQDSTEGSSDFDKEMISEQQKEQEAEREQEVLREPKGSRVDEDISPWNVAALKIVPAFSIGPHTFTDTTGEHPFYALSSFRLAECPELHLQVSPTVLLSHGFYKQRWAIQPNNHRRIKNVFVVMEWVVAAPSHSVSSSSTEFLTERSKRLKLLFNLLTGSWDESSTNALSPRIDKSTTAQVYQIIGATESKTLPATLDQATFSSIVDGQPLTEQYVVGTQERFWVCISLIEAETLRRCIHTRQGVFSQGVDVALMTLDGQVIEHSENFRILSQDPKRDSAMQTLRFFNNELAFNKQEIRALLRGVHASPKTRKTFYQHLLSCRHRDRQVFRSASVNAAFDFQDDLDWLQCRVQWLRLFQELQSHSLSILQSFTALDADNNGQLDEKEVFSGLQFAGMQVTSTELAACMRLADTDKHRQVSADQFYQLWNSIMTINEHHQQERQHFQQAPIHAKGASLHIPQVQPPSADTNLPTPSAAMPSRVEYVSLRNIHISYPVVPPEPARSWVCNICTLHNTGEINDCAACGLPRQ